MDTNTNREALVAEVAKWEETQARWEAEAASCAVEAAGIRGRMGEAVLGDEEQAQVLSAKLRELGDRADVAQRTAAAAAPKLKAAQAAVLEFDACRLDEEADRHEKVLQEHQAKTERLLAQLERHEGRFVHERGVSHDGSGVVEISGAMPKSYELQMCVERARLRAAVLRDVAAGHDPLGPNGRLTELATLDTRRSLIHGLSKEAYLSPAISGRDAVVPDRRHAEAVEGLRAQLEQHDEEAAIDVQPRIAELEDKIEKLSVEIDGRRNSLRGQLTQDESETLAGWRYLIRELETKRDTAAQRRAEIVAELESLVGPAAMAEAS